MPFLHSPGVAVEERVMSAHYEKEKINGVGFFSRVAEKRSQGHTL